MTRFPLLATALAAAVGAAQPASATPFTNSYTDGQNWNSIYAQGFSPFTQPSPDPGLDLLDTVSLDRFQFFKSGNDDVTDSVKLVILDNYFANLDGLTADSENVVGVSTNSISGTSQFAVGDPMTFNFSGVELTYGLDYAALYVTETDGVFTPVLVPSLIADYVETEAGSGVYVPESNYGDPDLEYQYSVSNYLTTNEFGSFLTTFSAPYADADFVAYYNLEPLAGDYNNDGVVNAADYTVWRDAEGTATTLPNETVTPGQVTTEDYQAWANNYGASFSLAAAVAVPEPLAWVAALTACSLAATAPRRR